MGCSGCHSTLRQQTAAADIAAHLRSKQQQLLVSCDYGRRWAWRVGDWLCCAFVCGASAVKGVWQCISMFAVLACFCRHVQCSQHACSTNCVSVHQGSVEKCIEYQVCDLAVAALRSFVQAVVIFALQTSGLEALCRRCSTNFVSCAGRQTPSCLQR